MSLETYYLNILSIREIHAQLECIPSYDEMIFQAQAGRHRMRDPLNDTRNSSPGFQPDTFLSRNCKKDK